MILCGLVLRAINFYCGHAMAGIVSHNHNDMSIVKSCFRIVNTCKPKYWIIENPAFGLRQVIGKPKIKINYSDFGYSAKKPTDLWGVYR